jgi:predicted TIM-barrel fold metal-dependent hydrolase
MRINCHAHIFNMQCILTQETITIIVGRLRQGATAFVADAVEGVLQSLLKNPRFLNEEDLLRLFLEKIGVSAAFKKATKSLTSLPPEFVMLGGTLDDLPLQALQAILDSLSTQFDKKDGSGGGVFDVWQTLRIALKPSCSAVANDLLGEMKKEDGLIALMMDITSETEPELDRKNFQRQLRETSEAVLQHPGRVFPFVAVNTRRANHLELLKSATSTMGFVGVKLYPSLGFRIDSDAMADVVDFCADNDLPITMHCNHGGFSKDAASVKFCDPEHWTEHLGQHENLRICFAHFGGIEGLFGTSEEETEWTDKIVAFMNGFPNVFADLSFHVDMMRDSAIEKRYFETLRTFLNQPNVGDRILFGTDSWLVRQHLGESNYWQFFENRMTAAEFAQIADTNPHRFLGLPQAAGGIRPNITSHVEFIRSNRMSVGAEPAAWVKAAIAEPFTVNRFAPEWTPNNKAHVVTFAVLKEQMTKAQKDAGFRMAGTFHLRELLYFKPDQLPEAIFNQQCDALALRLCKVAKEQPNAALENGATPESAFDSVRDLVGSGEETIAEMGGVIDSLFRFAEEPQ